jgi:hypothetical protein
MGAIQKIVENFDFETVHKVMVALNWKWGEGNDAHIPSIDELRESATNYLKQTKKAKSKHYSVGSGGFVATRWCNNLSLSFYATTWDEDF